MNWIKQLSLGSKLLALPVVFAVVQRTLLCKPRLKTPHTAYGEAVHGLEGPRGNWNSCEP